jgi:hypothetical protein
LKFRGVSRLISQEVHEQAADIFPSLPQWCKSYGNGAFEPVVERALESLFFDPLFQLAVGGGYDTNVDPFRLGSSQRQYLVIVEDPEQHGLNFTGQMAYLIEEDRPTGS